MSDSTLDDLKRRAFSSDGEDALAARQQLANLERALVAEQEPVETEAPHSVPELPRFMATPWWAVALLSALAVAAIGSSIVMALSPTAPLEIFDRPQNSRDLTLASFALEDAIAGTERWLGSADGQEIFGYLKDPENICLVAAQESTTRWTCATHEQFAANGLWMELSQTRDSVPGLLAVAWASDGAFSTDWTEYVP